MSITTLPCTTSPCHYLDGMKLGVGVDATVGKVVTDCAPAVKVLSTVQQRKEYRDVVSFRCTREVSELQYNGVIGFAGSLTFTPHVMGAGTQSVFDFSNSATSSTSSMFIIFDWERRFDSQRAETLELTESALTILKKDKENGTREFRKYYGDYYVYKIAWKAQFTVIWYVNNPCH